MHSCRVILMSIMACKLRRVKILSTSGMRLQNLTWEPTLFAVLTKATKVPMARLSTNSTWFRSIIILALGVFIKGLISDSTSSVNTNVNLVTSLDNSIIVIPSWSVTSVIIVIMFFFKRRNLTKVVVFVDIANKMSINFSESML